MNDIQGVIHRYHLPTYPLNYLVGSVYNRKHQNQAKFLDKGVRGKFDPETQSYRPTSWIEARIKWVEFVGKVTIEEDLRRMFIVPGHNVYSRDLRKTFLKYGFLSISDIFPDFPFDENNEAWGVKELFDGY
ncbi:hypothetical protein C8J56DRAFT_904106 [Mycena floridula]|nr:hypothetical protein C8J56DRAFT_904106 [Mycena floridula]